MSRPVYNVAITYVTSIHHVAIEYTEIYIYSRIEVRSLTRLLQGSGDDAEAVIEELRILIPILIRRRAILKKAKIKRKKEAIIHVDSISYSRIIVTHLLLFRRM